MVQHKLQELVEKKKSAQSNTNSKMVTISLNVLKCFVKVIGCQTI